ncbi:WPP domain-interacting protein 1 [Apostasia shenzhenica]|uniref:WPP domain-interacting protein 1 n=1 Tax=Apostasia shenzhenica TaxID=1088818 RepID=A0A2I0A733_9ASPA|nr:WPP domain-interacting protein 1 [Apostasia shenzhenica]
MDLEEGVESVPEQRTPASDADGAVVNGEINSEELGELDSSVESGVADKVGEVSVVGSPIGISGSTPATEIGTKGSMESSPRSSQSSPSSAAMKAAPAKGYGLRKWRRIRRDDLGKDGIGSADSAQILKRRLSNSEPSKAREENKMRSEVEQEAEDSVASLESRNAVVTPFSPGTGALGPELGALATSGFSIGMDSDNSEDRSSKSSTAASVPRILHDGLVIGREKSRAKNFGGRGSASSGQQRGQRSRIVDASKVRGEKARFEKENSLSSVESDLRSSTAGVLRWASTISSNGKHSERSLNSDGDEGQTGEEIQSGYYKENGGSRNLSREDLEAVLLDETVQNSENCQPSRDLDPFLESITLLQEAQEALENEIKTINDTRKEPEFNDIDSHFEEKEASSSSLELEAHVVELNEKIKHLESKLEEASETVKSKESKVLELEAALSIAHLSKMQDKINDLLFLEENQHRIESELEILLRRSLEAEIEYLIFTRTSQNLKILAEDHIALFKEKTNLLAGSQKVMLNLGDVEDKAFKLKDQRDMIEACCEDLGGTQNVQRLQKKVCKISLCCFVQLLLLCIAIGSFLMQLLPTQNEFVPT